MKALIGLTITEAKDVAKRELGIKRMSEPRFKMILEAGIKNGDFILDGDKLHDPATYDPTAHDPLSFLDEVEEIPEPQTKITHPTDAHIDPRLSSSDLPRPGDMYHYRSYTGEIVQGEIISVVCFAECKNPDGTWQSVALQDLHLKSKGVPKETLLNRLKAYFTTNDHLQAERKVLLKEIEALKEQRSELKSK